MDHESDRGRAEPSNPANVNNTQLNSSDHQQQSRARARTEANAADHEPQSQPTDSPLATPPLAAAMQDDRKTQSAPDGINATQRATPHHTDGVPSGDTGSSTAAPTRVGSQPNPPTPPAGATTAPVTGPLHARTSLQMPRPTYPRKSRASEEFDRRFDGPFGRPSLTMARRMSSSQQAAQIAEAAELGGDPGIITTPDGEDGEGGRAAAVAADGTEDGAGRPLGAVDTPVVDKEEAQLRRQATFEPEPPPLNYTLRTRKFAIFFFWSIILFDSVVMPIALYFGLWYGVGPGNPDDERLSANTVFSIVTAALGGASILEYFVRFWRLYKKGSTCRVIGAHRWYLDWFHWMFTLAWIVVMIELIVGSVQEDPYIRLLSMPLTTMLFVFGTLLLTIDLCRYFEVPAPVRISSIPKGSQLRPGIYSLIEDICAVDGSGGTDFRVAFDRRYEASHVFRAMLRRLGIFWAVGAESCAVLCTILIFTLSADAAYTIGWSVPFVWAGIWTAATFGYAKRELTKEKKLWSVEAAKCRV